MTWPGLKGKTTERQKSASASKGKRFRLPKVVEREKQQHKRDNFCQRTKKLAIGKVWRREIGIYVGTVSHCVAVSFLAVFFFSFFEIMSMDFRMTNVGVVCMKTSSLGQYFAQCGGGGQELAYGPWCWVLVLVMVQFP